MFVTGDFYYLPREGFYLVQKVITVDAESLYVRSFEPQTMLPDLSSLDFLDTLVFCEKTDPESLKDAVFLTNSLVTATELSEYEIFQKINKGLAGRKTRLLEIMKAADEFFLLENWEKAMHLYTEAASFARNNPEIFEKRGKCFEMLGMLSEAAADFNHAAHLRAQSI